MARSFASASSQYLVFSSPILSSYPVSMACWWYTTNDIGARDLMAISGLGGSQLMSAGGQHVIAATLNLGAVYADNVTGYSTSTWNHSTATFSSATNRNLYLNGGAAATNATSKAWPAVTETAIATRYSGIITSYFNGFIAEVGIWSAALTRAEADTLAAGHSPLLIRPQSLVAYWPLIGRTSPEIGLVGGYDMALVNAPTVAVHPRIIYPSNTQSGLTIPGAPPAGAIMPQFQYANLGASLYNGTLIG